MMYTLKGRYATAVTFLLTTFTLSHGNLFNQQQQQQQQQRYNPAVPPLPWYAAPPWEYILREIIVKSVAPSSDASASHKRPLDATFYAGPVAAYSSDDVIDVLSRGNIYHLLNGHWMLCQEGCVDCEPCAAQPDPLFKWVLRRVRRLPVSDPPRHDLQLTIMLQADDRLLRHASDFWPNLYVYVTFQEEEARTPPFTVVRTQRYDNERRATSPDLESSFSAQHHRSTKRRLTERDSTALGQDGNNPQQDHRVSLPGDASAEKPGRREPLEQNHGTTRRRRPRPGPAEKATTSDPTVRGSVDVTGNDAEEAANQLMPRLILGTDRKGQKHLIHVVPADHPPVSTSRRVLDRPLSSSQLIEDRAARSTDKTNRERQTYQQLFRRVFDSLNTHRRSIERFLEPSTDNANDHGTSTSADNVSVAGFSWNNRETRSASTDPGTARLNEAPLWSPYAGNDNRKYQRYRSRHGYEDTQQNFNNYYLPEYRDASSTRLPRNRQPMDLYSIDREGREIRVKPRSVNITRQNIPEIDLWVLSQSSDDFSTMDATKPASSGFVTNSVRQIDLNDTFVDKAFASSNDSIEASSITIDRENRQLFKPERLKSGDANREVRASHHPFRIIVTTEFSETHGERETPNRTKTPQTTTSKASADNS